MAAVYYPCRRSRLHGFATRLVNFIAAAEYHTVLSKIVGLPYQFATVRTGTTWRLSEGMGRRGLRECSDEDWEQEGEWGQVHYNS